MKKWQRNTLGIVGALAISVLANGIWEYTVRPVFSLVGISILNIASFGIASFKDSMYREIAKGLHEAASLALLNLSFFTLALTLSITTVALFAFHKQYTKILAEDLGETESELESLSKTISDNAPPPPLEELVEHLVARVHRLRGFDLKTRTKKQRRYMYFLICYGFTFVGLVIIQNTRSDYINYAIVHYKQTLLICGPYIEVQTQREFDSRFAAMQNRADYVRINEDISAHCGDMTSKIPRFDIW